MRRPTAPDFFFGKPIVKARFDAADRQRSRRSLFDFFYFRYGVIQLGEQPFRLFVKRFAWCGELHFFRLPVKQRNAELFFELLQLLAERRLGDMKLIHPQMNRGKALREQKDADVPLHLVERRKDGIIVSGIRLLATQGGITDEILVFPSTVKKSSSGEDPYALAFAIPNNTPGVKFICREAFDYGRSAATLCPRHYCLTAATI
ncbi:hypothetical protein GT94_10370 [Geobacillus stearothermophilus]|nr:hypothetical protein ET31_03775 [Geobacillus stearothermophilus]KFX33861.1 hypothetical protein GT94_10370 [Geobacillus stearothermophilus]